MMKLFMATWKLARGILWLELEKCGDTERPDNYQPISSYVIKSDKTEKMET